MGGFYFINALKDLGGNMVIIWLFVTTSAVVILVGSMYDNKKQPGKKQPGCYLINGKSRAVSMFLIVT